MIDRGLTARTRRRASEPPRARALLPATRLALALAVSALALGCRREGAPFECHCEWLTDYDDASKVEVHVCANDAQEAPSVARGCAQLGTPAPVQDCTCASSQTAAPSCRHGCLDTPAAPASN